MNRVFNNISNRISCFQHVREKQNGKKMLEFYFFLLFLQFVY